MKSLSGVRATTAPAAFQRSTRAMRLCPKSSKVGTYDAEQAPSTTAQLKPAASQRSHS